jgi:hypothetical protein
MATREKHTRTEKKRHKENLTAQNALLESKNISTEDINEFVEQSTTEGASGDEILELLLSRKDKLITALGKNPNNEEDRKEFEDAVRLIVFFYTQTGEQPDISRRKPNRQKAEPSPIYALKKEQEYQLGSRMDIDVHIHRSTHPISAILKKDEPKRLEIPADTNALLRLGDLDGYLRAASKAGKGINDMVDDIVKTGKDTVLAVLVKEHSILNPSDLRAIILEKLRTVNNGQAA